MTTSLRQIEAESSGTLARHFRFAGRRSLNQALGSLSVAAGPLLDRATGIEKECSVRLPP
jgi:hypothetical protein